jgi:hypothetical protein
MKNLSETAARLLEGEPQLPYQARYTDGHGEKRSTLIIPNDTTLPRFRKLKSSLYSWRSPIKFAIEKKVKDQLGITIISAGQDAKLNLVLIIDNEEGKVTDLLELLADPNILTPDPIGQARSAGFNTPEEFNRYSHTRAATGR